MKTITFYREDFNDCKGSFDKILSLLGIPSKYWDKVQSIDVKMTNVWANFMFGKKV